MSDGTRLPPPSPIDTRTVTAGPRTIGRAISAAIAAGMLVDGALKVMHTAHMMHGMGALGYPPTTVTLIGMIAMACALLYTIPRTAPLGAVLLTAYLGGAVATHVRVDDGGSLATLLPAAVGVMAWVGLLLREPRWMQVWRSTWRRAPDGR